MMKTFEELYNEIITSEELLKEFSQVDDNDKMESFLKKYDCSASVEEAVAFVQEKSQELSEDDLDAAAGGANAGQWVNMGANVIAASGAIINSIASCFGGKHAERAQQAGQIIGTIGQVGGQFAGQFFNN